MRARQRPWSQRFDIAVIAISTIAVAFATVSIRVRGGEPDSKTQAAREQFFEQNVRPLLAENCYSCHGDKKQKGGLRLDSLEAILKGGESGPAVVPGKPDEACWSRRSTTRGSEMPPTGKLGAEKVAVAHALGLPGCSLAQPRSRGTCTRDLAGQSQGIEAQRR